MPLIDVSDVLSSLDIADQLFDVIRRTETVNNFGESVLATVTIPDQVGACQPLGDNSMLREEQYTTNANGLTVWTTTRLYNASRTVLGVKYQPDLIVFDGNTYLVKSVDSWAQFGAGFVKAECISFAYIPAPGDS